MHIIDESSCDTLVYLHLGDIRYHNCFSEFWIVYFPVFLVVVGGTLRSMHYPPVYDVDVTCTVLSVVMADDYQCRLTGEVRSCHRKCPQENNNYCRRITDLKTKSFQLSVHILLHMTSACIHVVKCHMWSDNPTVLCFIDG